MADITEIGKDWTWISGDSDYNLAQIIKNMYGGKAGNLIEYLDPKIASGEISSFTGQDLYNALSNNPYLNYGSRVDEDKLYYATLEYKYKQSAVNLSNIGSVSNSNNLPATNGYSSYVNTTGIIDVKTDTSGNLVSISASPTEYIDAEIVETTPTNPVSKVFGTVGSAIAAVSTGMKLGVAIDDALYKIGDVFDIDALKAFDTTTFKQTIVEDKSTGASVLKFIFGLKDDNNMQAYMQEDAFVLYARYLNHLSFFSDSYYNQPTYTSTTIASSFSSLLNFLYVIFPTALLYENMADCIGQIHSLLLNEGLPEYGAYSFSGIIFNVPTAGGLVIVYYPDISIGTTVFRSKGTHISIKYEGRTGYTPSAQIVEIKENTTVTGLATPPKVCTVNTSISFKPDGVTKIENGTLPVLDHDDTQDIARNKLKDQYPELWNNRLENSVLQPDGSTRTITYLPVGFPTGSTNNLPTTIGVTDPNSTIDPNDTLESILKTVIKIITQIDPQPNDTSDTDDPVDPIDPTPNPDPDGSGSTPTNPIPTGTAEALWSIYNPTLAEVKQLGSWLWSTDFVDQIQKIFNDPMQAIISLHKVFGTPIVDGTNNIKVGYLDTGVSSNTVGNQYTTVNCGSVDLPEYFGNVFDYSPYTTVDLYLPFIGIVPLDVADIMRSTISITYHIDVLTGACLAEVSVKRDNSGGVLYTYSGNCSVEYPLSSGTYSGLLSGLVGLASVGVGVASGGSSLALGATAMSAVSQLGKADIGRSGGFSGNSGAMGIKKPYLIISRPQTDMASNVERMQGYPSNSYVNLSSCSGFTKVKAVHVDSIDSATDEEKDLIENALKEGVIIN